MDGFSFISALVKKNPKVVILHVVQFSKKGRSKIMSLIECWVLWCVTLSYCFPMSRYSRRVLIAMHYERYIFIKGPQGIYRNGIPSEWLLMPIRNYQKSCVYSSNIWLLATYYETFTGNTLFRDSKNEPGFYSSSDLRAKFGNNSMR